LLGQAISLGQQIYRAREGVRGAPKLLSDQSKQLQDLLSTIELIQNEEELQTTEIGDLLLRVHELAKEFQRALEAIARLQEKSKAGQVLRALGTGERKEKELQGILDRLDQVNANLSMRIQLAHVRVTTTTRDGFTAALPTIQRIDENVKRALGSRLSMAVQLQARQPSQRCLYKLHLFQGID
jgi:hypothetical protein